MNTGAKWGIGLGAGIPGALILIGLIGFLIKFIMQRCRSKAWDEIISLPKHLDSSDNSTNRRPPKRLSTEREPLFPTTTPNVAAVSDGHISIPIDDNNLSSGQHSHGSAPKHEHTIVQIQRERLNRLKEEENRSRPMLSLSTGELDMQYAIDQAQKEFEESTAIASGKAKDPR
ncbi:unnamed protein product [Rotaria sordida]|uniref:Uncharacterized protein n=1 Tax=Rotaria sordida TaxID=392033 RepID=A0A813ZKW6_9BILA|nr:unnamed protein product [Rotaria sordida]CAF0900873.1 unnamed protein product [Rotaria sordida]CAF0905143.1 unnamed protein product [Rotaria sordida]CAF1003672.1 unnamed protein product [Rotaria sordida]CAF3720661.1 unnamed protein product [Rotaria sordida]